MPLLRIELNRHQILNERCLNFIHEMWLVDVAVRMASVDIKALVSVLFFGGGLLWILTSMQSPPTAPNSDSDALKSPSSNSPITESRSSRLCLTSSLKKKKLLIITGSILASNLFYISSGQKLLGCVLTPYFVLYKSANIHPKLDPRYSDISNYYCLPLKRFWPSTAVY